MTGPGLFLCGCDPKVKFKYNVSQRPDGTVSGERRDEGGYLVCPEHGVRMYGWASPLVQHPGGQTLTDWSKMGSNTPLRNLDTSQPDRRVFIDTIAYGTERLARRAASGNGAPSESGSVGT